MKSRKTKYRGEEERPDDDQLDEDRPPQNRPPKAVPRKRRKLPWLFLLLLFVIALLPTIVAQTPLRNVVISALLPTNDIRVSVGSASFGWFTPPSVGQVEVFDASGDVLFRADSISTDRAGKSPARSAKPRPDRNWSPVDLSEAEG